MIDFGWETQIDRLKRHMSIPPKKKLELLYKLNCFTQKYAVKNSSKLNKSVKEARSRTEKVKPWGFGLKKIRWGLFSSEATSVKSQVFQMAVYKYTCYTFDYAHKNVIARPDFQVVAIFYYFISIFS